MSRARRLVQGLKAPTVRMREGVPGRGNFAAATVQHVAAPNFRQTSPKRPSLRTKKALLSRARSRVRVLLTSTGPQCAPRRVGEGEELRMHVRRLKAEVRR